MSEETELYVVYVRRESRDPWLFAVCGSGRGWAEGEAARQQAKDGRQALVVPWAGWLGQGQIPQQLPASFREGDRLP